MRYELLAVFYGLLLLAAAVVGIGKAVVADDYPFCYDAPVNATSARCPFFIATAQTAGVVMFFAQPLFWVAAFALPSAKVVMENTKRKS